MIPFGLPRKWRFTVDFADPKNENLGDMSESCGPDAGVPAPPHCLSIDVEPGLNVDRYLLLPSPVACCAQTTLPFWARIIGTIRNHTDAEGLVSVTVMLLDDRSAPLAGYSDIMAIESGDEAEFDVKLVEYGDKTAAYTITARFMDE
jgi:hypothetical protein